MLLLNTTDIGRINGKSDQVQFILSIITGNLKEVYRGVLLVGAASCITCRSIVNIITTELSQTSQILYTIKYQTHHSIIIMSVQYEI